jgi:hypothetical protein
MVKYVRCTVRKSRKLAEDAQKINTSTAKFMFFMKAYSKSPIG